jgi:polyphosphate kinase
MDECLSACLHDTKDAWLLQPDGRYIPAIALTGAKGRAAVPLSAQTSLMTRYGSKG